jgi:hypothetical protein
MLSGLRGVARYRDDARRRFVANANLGVVDERCAPLDYIMGASRAIEIDYLTSNNFASAASTRPVRSCRG